MSHVAVLQRLGRTPAKVRLIPCFNFDLKLVYFSIAFHDDIDWYFPYFIISSNIAPLILINVHDRHGYSLFC